MAHETPTINATTRDQLGTRYSKRLRKTGRLPGVIYGHKANPVAISVDEKETLTVLKKGAHVINVAIDGKQPETCLIKDLQFGYLGDNVIHVDFARVDLNEEVAVVGVAVARVQRVGAGTIEDARARSVAAAPCVDE